MQMSRSRRSPSHHLPPASALQVAAPSSCSPRWPSASGSCRSSSTSSYEEMAENNHQRTLALRAPRGVLFDRNGDGARREPPLVHHLDRPRAHQGPGPHDPPAVAGGRASIRSRWSRSSSATAASRPTARSSSSRTPRWRRSRRSRARRLDFELPDVVVEEVPTRQYPDRRAGRAPVRLRRRSQRAAGRRAASRRARSSASQGVEKVYNDAADGRGRRQARRRQQHGPRDPDARGDRRRSKAAACS